MLSKLILTRLSIRLIRLSSYFFTIWRQRRHRHVTYLLKSVGHSSMKLDIENMYLVIHYNMPPLAGWNPRLFTGWIRNLDEHDKGQEGRNNYIQGSFCGGCDNCRKEWGFRFGGWVGQSLRSHQLWSALLSLSDNNADHNYWWLHKDSLTVVVC